MTSRVAPTRRLAGAIPIALGFCLALSGSLTAAPTDPELLATVELPQGDIEYELELGTLHAFDGEGAPFAVQVIDGCDVNDRLWLLGVGLSAIPIPLDLVDLRSARSVRTVLPAFEPGARARGILEPEALDVCGDDPRGGLPSVSGTATFTAAGGRGRDYRADVTLLSDGRDDAYRRIVRIGAASDVISRGSPVFAVDDSGAYDELMLLAEGRTPRRVEGVVFRGDEGMLPGRAALERALDDIARSRVRRAFETAKNSRVPQAIIEDLGLRGVDEVHHVGFDFDTLGADAYLQGAKWIATRGEPIEPPRLVEERFTVELVRADGETIPLQLAGPLQGSDADGQLWQYRGERALVQLVDGCEVSGAFWIAAAAVTDEPVELVVSDTTSGVSSTQVLWTDREEVSRLADTTSLVACP
jgi:hypothetical protein